MRFSVLNLDTFHIDHDRSKAKKDKTFIYNWNLAQEIGTYSGPAINNYINKLQKNDLGNPKKYERDKHLVEDVPRFVLAITTFNRLEYLRDMLISFFATRSENANWKIIIADDRSTDGTLEFINDFDFQGVPYVILQNQRCGVHHQVSIILDHLSNSNFDLCFKCDDDLFFKNKGWDELYWETVQRTGYEHLIYFNKSWRPELVRKAPIISGNLISNCECENISGAMYTITPELIKKVGYFDVFNYGFRGVGHQDFSLRCCRAGLNVIEHPFDVKNSNDFIQLRGRKEYKQSLNAELVSLLDSTEIKKFKAEPKKINRIYIPYNENYSTSRDQVVIRNFLQSKQEITVKEEVQEVQEVESKLTEVSKTINKEDYPKMVKDLKIKELMIPTQVETILSNPELDAVLSSLSWKITAPIRWLGEKVNEVIAIFK